MSNNELLNRALVAYIGHGVDLAPSRDRHRVEQIVGPADVATTIHRIEDLLKEAGAVEIDWNVFSLASAGDHVMKTMKQRHPELSGAALRAIAWKFTFDWR